MQLIKLFNEINVNLDFSASDKEDALKQLSLLICKGRDFLNGDKVYTVLKEREELGSTGIGNEVAIRCGKLDIEESLVGAFAVSKNGVKFDAIDKKNVKIFFVLIAAKNATNLHLKILAKISRHLMDNNFRNTLKSLKNFNEFKKIISE